ncbi:hypothetical protein [Collinsella ihumii]|uniref:LA2681-like HEPN domain-containing protein n=1 Tax=Collinsella ihumii TaxID=1720204 RepID=A0AAW7JQ86_9ACTN|nr:hypothetical protein [Collinsella ihumii]MDN0069719.1 hypothetical protein [Collinsella ihumii]
MRDHDSFEQFTHDYWSYYRELEDDFLATRKYVSFDPDNYSTYSIEYLKLFQAACSEIDVLGKSMAYAVNHSLRPNGKNINILKWWFEIQDSYFVSSKQDITYMGKQPTDRLSEAACLFLGTTKIKPWDSFRVEKYTAKDHSTRVRAVNDSMPLWWLSYNKVKHSRISLITQKNEKPNYSKANLGNVIYALSALYILEKAYMEAIGTQDDIESFFDQSKLFVKRAFVTSKDIDSLFMQSRSFD